MLVSLYIRDFGIVDEMQVDFKPGFNVITGETGAGKSIVIAAIQAACGGRVRSDQVRAGSEKAVVEAVFDLTAAPSVGQILRESGLDTGTSEDGLLLMTREISASGRSLCRLNGRPVPLSLYRTAGRGLVDLHVQNEQNSLLERENHARLLDRFGGQALMAVYREVVSIYRRWKEAAKKLEELTGHSLKRKERFEILSYQIAEIESARIAEGEEEELLAEKAVLSSAEKIKFLAERAHGLLRGGSELSPVLDTLAQAVSALKGVVAVDARLSNILSSVEEAFYQLEEAARELGDYCEGLEFSPQKLEEVEERLLTIKKIKKKYGQSVEEIISFKEAAQNELASLKRAEEEACATQSEIRELLENYRKAALVLTSSRTEAARRLEGAVAAELASLDMNGVKFKVIFTPVDGPSPQGAEEIEFFISPNPGEPLKPLSRVASGGEMARIMLALKVLLADVDGIPVIVFDEVDTGVGGGALKAIGEKMARLGEKCQVICVTHSARVASFARTHYKIEKQLLEDRAVSRLKLLDERERLLELARMLGGKEVTDITVKHALQMYESASGEKHGNGSNRV